MRACITVAVAAVFLLAADEPKPGSNDIPPPRGWSLATEGSGVPRGQDASGYAAGVDREVTHGGRAAMSMRSVVSDPKAFRAFAQFIKADAYRGKRVRLVGYLKTRDVARTSGLWLRVDGPDAALLAFDNMVSRPVSGTTPWSRYEVVLDVPDAASRLAFGALLHGAGQVWADDLSLDVVDPKDVKVTVPAISLAERATNLDFEAPVADPAHPVPGWSVFAPNPKSYARHIAEGAAHGGRGFLEVKSTPTELPSSFSVYQEIAATPYLAKRVRFRAYLKTEGVADAASVWINSLSKSGQMIASTSAPGSKGTAGWTPREAVLDVEDNAGKLVIGVVMKGAGTLGVDDASLEVVDPAKVPVTAKSEFPRADPEKRARELKEALATMPDRPVNLDFEL